MVKVSGSVGDIAYRVTLTGKAATPVVGSKAVATLVDAAIEEGRTVLVGPTGPRRPVKAGDYLSLVRFLASIGEVTRVDGLDDSHRLPPPEPGVIL